MRLSIGISGNVWTRANEGENCGTGAGGFQPGNTCGKESAGFQVKPPKKLYRGVSATGGGIGLAMLGKGLYSTWDKSFARKYGTVVKEVTAEEGWPKRPLDLRHYPGDGPSAFRDWALQKSGAKNIRDFHAKYPDPAIFVKEQGFDGVIAGDEVVKYSANEFIEEEHPRATDGKFAVKEGTGSPAAAPESGSGRATRPSIETASLLRPVKLDAKQRAVIGEYQENSYSINGYLREGPVGYAPEDVQISVIRMDKIFKEKGTVISVPLKLYRGIDAEDMKDGKDGGYVSATTSKESAAFFGDTVMELEVPVGTRLLPILGGKESEVILPRGMVFKRLNEVGEVERKGEKKKVVAVKLSANEGEGVACGESYISAEKECRIGQGAAPEPKQEAAAAPVDGFDAAAWAAKPVPDRVKEWGSLSQSKRDELADATRSVPARRDALLAPLGERPAPSGDSKADTAARLAQASEHITPYAATRIQRHVDRYSDLMNEAGVKPELATELVAHATDTLLAQEMEGMERQLGDHGIAHIGGNIDRALKILDVVPGEDTAKDKLQVMVANIYHDTGYMTGPARNFLDEGHPRWSAEHYNAEIKPLVAEALGKRAANEIEHSIRTHADTSINWKEDAVGSAVRVSDNTGLFQRDKLPPLFRHIPANIETLSRLSRKEITLPDAQKEMRARIEASDYPAPVKASLSKAAGEVGPMTGKFTLGMMGGNIEAVNWKDGHVEVTLREDKLLTQLHKIGDFGQRQFGKFAESYGQDPEAFKNSLEFTFRDRAGNPLLSSRVVKGAANSRVGVSGDEWLANAGTTDGAYKGWQTRRGLPSAVPEIVDEEGKGMAGKIKPRGRYWMTPDGESLVYATDDDHRGTAMRMLKRKFNWEPKEPFSYDPGDDDEISREMELRGYAHIVTDNSEAGKARMWVDGKVSPSQRAALERLGIERELPVHHVSARGDRIIPIYEPPDSAANEGTTEGAIKGWETRKRGDHTIKDEFVKENLSADSLSFATHAHVPESLNGVPFAPVKDYDSTKIPDVKMDEPPLPHLMPHEHMAAGVILTEPDGRVWLYEPKNHWAGYQNTFSKGTQEEGMTLQQTALKELHEETGLTAEIKGYVGDWAGTQSVSRFYHGVRTGGSPTAHKGDETLAVKLVTPDDAGKILNTKRDQKILHALADKGIVKRPTTTPEFTPKTEPKTYGGHLFSDDEEDTLPSPKGHWSDAPEPAHKWSAPKVGTSGHAWQPQPKPVAPQPKKPMLWTDYLKQFGNEFEEEKHPRDEKGRFAQTGKAGDHAPDKLKAAVADNPKKFGREGEWVLTPDGDERPVKESVLNAWLATSQQQWRWAMELRQMDGMTKEKAVEVEAERRAAAAVNASENPLQKGEVQENWRSHLRDYLKQGTPNYRVGVEGVVSEAKATMKKPVEVFRGIAISKRAKSEVEHELQTKGYYDLPSTRVASWTADKDIAKQFAESRSKETDGGHGGVAMMIRTVANQGNIVAHPDQPTFKRLTEKRCKEGEKFWIGGCDQKEFIVGNTEGYLRLTKENVTWL